MMEVVESTSLKNQSFLNLNNECPIRRKTLEIEKELFTFILNGKFDLEIFDVPINYKGKHHIHTVRIGKITNEKILVVTHGYNSNVVSLNRICYTLASEYLIYLFDWIGHGLSSRESLNFNTTEETLDFYIESIEIWRKYLGIKKFHFAAHSMGGYLGVSYCLRYPDALTKISMVSPAGITDPTSDDEIYQNNNCIQVFGFKILELVHGWLTVKSVYNKAGCLKKLVYDLTHKGLYYKTGPVVSKKMYDYNFNLILLEGDIEKDLALVFSKYVPLLQFPLEPRIDQLHSTVDIYYGSNDWMERIGAIRVTKKYPEKFKMHVIEGSGHSIFMDEPDKICAHLINNYDYQIRNSPKKKHDNDCVISRNALLKLNIKKREASSGVLSPVSDLKQSDSSKDVSKIKTDYEDKKKFVYSDSKNKVNNNIQIQHGNNTHDYDASINQSRNSDDIRDSKYNKSVNENKLVLNLEVKNNQKAKKEDSKAFDVHYQETFNSVKSTGNRAEEEQVDVSINQNAKYHIQKFSQSSGIEELQTFYKNLEKKNVQASNFSSFKTKKSREEKETYETSSKKQNCDDTRDNKTYTSRQFDDISSKKLQYINDESSSDVSNRENIPVAINQKSNLQSILKLKENKKKNKSPNKKGNYANEKSKNEKLGMEVTKVPTTDKDGSTDETKPGKISIKALSNNNDSDSDI